MTACAVAFLLAVQFGALAGARPEPVEQLAMLIETHREHDEPIGVYQVFVRNLPFYTHAKQVVLFDETHVRDFLKSDTRVFLVARKADLPLLEDVPGPHLQQLGEVQYLNTAEVRLRTVLAPRPEEEIQTVVLVSNR